jgi:hypothetical protein
MLTGAAIISHALEIARAPLYTAQAQDLLNAILSDLCQEYDLALARGLFQFNFNPALVTMFGSGPYPLPLDYLRTSGSSGATGTSKSVWYLYPTPAFPAGQPIFMTPIDLAQFDMLPQFPNQTTPELWATDVGGPITERITLVTTAALVSGSSSATLASATGAATGQAIAGEGIVPGTTLTNLVGAVATLSKAATKTIAAASVFLGIAPNGFAYPPPLGSYPVSIRYQRQMPPLTDLTQVPWFPNDGYLIEELAGRVMALTDDSRAQEYIGNGVTPGRSGMRLRKYLALSDDKTNRAQQVQLDPRNFGGGTSYSRARNTKVQGW